MREGPRALVRRGIGREDDLDYTESGGVLAGADPGQVSERARQRGAAQVGTLGAGNHFLELHRLAPTLPSSSRGGHRPTSVEIRMPETFRRTHGSIAVDYGCPRRRECRSWTGCGSSPRMQRLWCQVVRAERCSRAQRGAAVRSVRRPAPPAAGSRRGRPARRLASGRGLDAPAMDRADPREGLRDRVHAAALLPARAVAGRRRSRGNPATRAAWRRCSDLDCALHRCSSWSCTRSSPSAHGRTSVAYTDLPQPGSVADPDDVGPGSGHDGSRRWARVQLEASRPLAPGPPRGCRTGSAAAKPIGSTGTSPSGR